jgi:hypothetical protein
MRSGRLFWILLCLAFPSGTALGGLLFTDRVMEFEAAPDAEEVEIEFPFEVKGKKEVRIKSFDAPCSCVTAQISGGGKLVWKPGEKGVVKGVFALGTFKGTVEKYIILDLAGEDSVVKLTLMVTIPELVKVEPPTLMWEVGGKMKPKSFKITMHGDTPIHLLEATVSNTQFEQELKTIREGEEYELVVTPKDLGARALGMIRLRTDSTMTRHQRYQAFVMIRSGVPSKK